MNQDQENLRRRIDAADDEIVAALRKRFALAVEMRALKKAQNLPRLDLTREREIYDRVTAAVEPADRNTVYAIYEKIFGGSRGVVETIARGVCVRDGKVLLCRPKKGGYSYLPGGHIEFGEKGAEALVREVREELGVESSAGELLGVVETAFEQNGERHAEISLVYRLELGADFREPVSQESWIEFVWWPVAELEAANLLPAESKRYVG